MKIILLDSCDDEESYDGKNNDTSYVEEGICTECGEQVTLGTIYKKCEDSGLIYESMDGDMLQLYKFQLNEHPVEGTEAILGKMRTNGIESCVTCVSRGPINKICAECLICSNFEIKNEVCKNYAKGNLKRDFLQGCYEQVGGDIGSANETVVVLMSVG